METTGPLCQLIDGRLYHVYIDPLILRKALQFEPKEHDIVQVTFPKSGTHWVQQIVQLILNHGESAKDLREFARRAPLIEMQGEGTLSGSKFPQLILTHLRLGRFAYRREAKYLYIARNPWDCCASMYHFFKELPCLNNHTSLDEFVDLFLEGRTGWGDYFGHVLSGYTWRTEPNVFFTTYEELSRDTRGSILKLAYFMGQEHGRAIENDQNFLSAVLEKSSIKYMRGIFNMSEKITFELFAKNPDMRCPKENSTELGDVLYVRHGKVGEWKHLFGREHLERFEHRIKEVFRDSDIMNLWKEQWMDAKKLLSK